MDRPADSASAALPGRTLAPNDEGGYEAPDCESSAAASMPPSEAGASAPGKKIGVSKPVVAIVASSYKQHHDNLGKKIAGELAKSLSQQNSRDGTELDWSATAKANYGKPSSTAASVGKGKKGAPEEGMEDVALEMPDNVMLVSGRPSPRGRCGDVPVITITIVFATAVVLFITAITLDPFCFAAPGAAGALGPAVCQRLGRRVRTLVEPPRRHLQPF